jgi:pyoverdine/dityrosine biosynthesis protein Dit1
MESEIKKYIKQDQHLSKRFVSEKKLKTVIKYTAYAGFAE